MLRALKAYFPAVLLTYVLASVVATQVVLSRVAAMGLVVSPADRFSASVHDLLGLLSSYLPLIAIAFLLALPVAAGLSRRLARHRALLYLLAGFIALVALHLIMKAVLGVSGIAATRSVPGLLSQGAAGALGGLCFHGLTRQRGNS